MTEKMLPEPGPACSHRRESMLNHHLGKTIGAEGVDWNPRKTKQLSILLHRFVLEFTVAKSAEIKPPNRQVITVYQKAPTQR